MTDDEFKTKVLRDLAAIKARLDDHEAAHDVLVGQVGRLRSLVMSSLKLNDSDLAEVAALGRRVMRLEHPNGGT